MKRIVKWLFYKENDVSSLITLVIALVFIQLFDVNFNNKLLLIPYLIVLLVGLRLLIELWQVILQQRNVELSRSYFISAIFIVFTVTAIIEITLL